MGGRGVPLARRGVRRGRLREHRGDPMHLRVRIHGERAQHREGGVRVDAVELHQDALGLLDDRAVVGELLDRHVDLLGHGVTTYVGEVDEVTVHHGRPVRVVLEVAGRDHHPLAAVGRGDAVQERERLVPVDHGLTEVPGRGAVLGMDVPHHQLGARHHCAGGEPVDAEHRLGPPPRVCRGAVAVPAHDRRVRGRERLAPRTPAHATDLPPQTSRTATCCGHSPSTRGRHGRTPAATGKKRPGSSPRLPTGAPSRHGCEADHVLGCVVGCGRVARR